VKLRDERVGLADVLRSVGASPRRPRVCSFVQGYLPWRAHTVEAACTPFSFEAASVPHATTRLASFLWTEGACLVALVWSVCLCEPPWASPGRLQLHVASWLVGCPRAAEAACDVVLLQVDLAV
jgi:hypothetical protein